MPDRERFMQYPSMDPQPCCALPWCGKSFAGPLKRYHITDHITGEKRTVEYPAGIDAHHVIEEKRGPVVYVCHECHMEHENVYPVDFDYHNGWYANGVEMRVYNEFDQTAPPTTEDALGSLADDLREKKHLSDTMDYLLSLDLAEGVRRIGRKDLADWVVDNLSVSPRSVDAYLSKRLAYATLPEDFKTLGITNGYRMFQLHEQGHALRDLLRDFTTMGRSHFDTKYRLKEGDR